TEVVLPAAPHSRVATRPKKRVSKRGRVSEGRRIIGPGWCIVERLIGLAAPVRRLVHHLAIALVQVQGLENVKVVLIHDVSVGISWSELKVGDQRILRVGRTDFTRRDAGDEFILPDTCK